MVRMIATSNYPIHISCRFLKQPHHFAVLIEVNAVG